MKDLSQEKKHQKNFLKKEILILLNGLDFEPWADSLPESLSSKIISLGEEVNPLPYVEHSHGEEEDEDDVEEVEDDVDDVEEDSEEDDDEGEEEDLAEMYGLNELSLEELAEICAEHGLSTKGKRQALIDRIIRGIKDGTIEVEDEEEGE